MKKNKQGFTLIELLVVIAIIGLLSTLSIVALNQARARSRDARRLADVKQIQTALEMYYNDYNQYPATADVVAGSSIGTSSASTSPYLANVPAPPTPADGGCATASQYTYSATALNGAPNSTYTLTYCLGSTAGGLKAGSKTATPSGIAQQGQNQ